jgi:hypothetical protein
MEMTATVRRMKGLRNLLVHEYERLDDEIVFETLTHRLGDFEAFKREVLDFLRRAPLPEAGGVLAPARRDCWRDVIWPLGMGP